MPNFALYSLPTSSSLTHQRSVHSFLHSHPNFVSFIIWGDTLPHKTQNPFCSVTRDSDSRRHRKSRTKATFTDSLAIRFFSVFLSLSLSVTVRVYCFLFISLFLFLVSCTAIFVSFIFFLSKPQFCFGGGVYSWISFGFGFN